MRNGVPMKPVIAIIGRPNVGKSTLFNRIVGRSLAIVADVPGVTRDRIYAEAEHKGRRFTLIDTGGCDPEAQDGLLGLMQRQVAEAIKEADALIVVMDGRAGLTPLDESVWAMVKASQRPAYLVVNKIDTPDKEGLVFEFFRLGNVEPIPVSAEKGSGVLDLLDKVVEDFPPSGDETDLEEGKLGERIRVAIVGRPNVGKSTFANAWLGRERFLTSDMPGTTVDSVEAVCERDGRTFVLVDTAGVRRRKKVERGIERMSVARAIRAIEESHVTALILDAKEGITDQDKKLASLVVDRGRGLILVFNKWDLIEKGPGIGDAYLAYVKSEMAFASFAPVLFTSALTGKGMHRFSPTVSKVAENLFRRIPTHEINRFYREVIKTKPPVISGTRTAKIRYLTQVSVNPPTILLFTGGGVALSQAYLRFLANEMRSRFDFQGVPIRLIERRSD